MTATTTQSPRQTSTHTRFARCVEVSKRVRWEIERDVIRGRKLNPSEKFLPDGLSLVSQMHSPNGVGLNEVERRFFSQVQGRTYANMFGLVERFINAKVLELSHRHWLGDQIALEALVRFSDEELKHQELFRRVEKLAADVMPGGYRFLPQPNEVASVVLGKSTWAVLALTCLIELFTQSHYKQSIASDSQLSELYRDIFLFHWKEESQHAILDELEWTAENRRLDADQREQAVTDLLELVAAVDGILQLQSAEDARYFAQHIGRKLDDSEVRMVESTLLKAYRWQYIFSGVQQTRFVDVLRGMISSDQFARIEAALTSLA